MVQEMLCITNCFFHWLLDQSWARTVSWKPCRPRIAASSFCFSHRAELLNPLSYDRNCTLKGPARETGAGFLTFFTAFSSFEVVNSVRFWRNAFTRVTPSSTLQGTQSTSKLLLVNCRDDLEVAVQQRGWVVMRSQYIERLVQRCRFLSTSRWNYYTAGKCLNRAPSFGTCGTWKATPFG